MNSQEVGLVKIAIAVVIVGIGALVVLSIQVGGRAPGMVQNPQIMPSTSSAAEQSAGVNPILATLPTTMVSPMPEDTAVALLLPTPTPAPTQSARPSTLLTIPEVPVPENGQVYTLHPSNSLAVGWVRANDGSVNHFGDYNIYAGVFNSQQHIGAVQFDLSTIPPGSPILYADLTLSGLVDDYLGDSGVWSLQMLNGWMNEDWVNRDFYWLAREDSGSVILNDPVTSVELGEAIANTFYMPAEGLSLLEASLFSGAVSFRIMGPKEGPDNLFSWDGGYGSRSLGRAPILRIVTAGPAPLEPPTPTPDYVIVTPVPTDGEALLALAAEHMNATAEATPEPLEGTPSPTPTVTPLPPNWVTPVIVTNTPTPETEATAVWQAQIATAQAIVHGTPTATPPNVWTATPTPLPPPDTPTPLIVAYELLTATPTPTSTPEAIPDILRGKILFYSDRTGDSSLMVMDPDGSNVAVWTGGSSDWIYAQAKLSDDMSPDGIHRVVVSSEQISSLQLWTIDLTTGERFQLTQLDDIAYDPVWSPAANGIAFVSPAPGNDEIFRINADGTDLTQLTHNEWEWDKHPSWSSDGTQIVFWSNRETKRKQIWIMNADGSNVRNLSNNEYNDWDPVWVK